MIFSQTIFDVPMTAAPIISTTKAQEKAKNVFKQ
jgi:hypothetical protein